MIRDNCSDNHACWGVPSGETKKDSKKCPDCGEKGQAVSADTALHFVREERIEQLDGKDLMFCKTPTCSIVYYNPAGGPSFRKDEIRVRVGLKETEDPVWVCYCFDVSKRHIREEIKRTGQSTASRRIREEVEDGNCACEVKNPSGRCCLGEVRVVEKDLLKNLITKS